MAKKAGPSRDGPQGPRGLEPYWYYESRRGIQVYARVAGEKNAPLAIVMIPWSQLLRSAARCGKIASNEGQRRKRSTENANG
jgi:hypothetical protein